MRTPTLVALALLTCSVAAADPGRARKLNSDGMKHYGKRELG